MTPAWDRGFVDSEGESIYYETVGDGPAVVLAHGAGGNHGSWFQQVLPLAEHHRVVTWDQRGFGRSTNHAEAAGPAASARDLLAVLDHLGLADAHLVGQSLGGWTVLQAAVEQPSRSRSIVLTDTVAGIYTPLVEARFDAYLEAMAAAAAEPIRAGRPPALDAYTWEHDPERSFLYQQLGSIGGQGPADAIARIRAFAQPAERVAAVSCPVLFVVGEHDPVFPPVAVRDAAARVTQARVAVVEHAGHSAHFEQAAAWNALVLGFLAEATSAAPTSAAR